MSMAATLFAVLLSAAAAGTRANTATVEFTVDMNGVDQPSAEYDSVVVHGTWNGEWEGKGVTLADEDEDGIFTGSLEYAATYSNDVPELLVLDAGASFEYVVAVTGAADEHSGWGLQWGDGCEDANVEVTVGDAGTTTETSLTPGCQGRCEGPTPCESHDATPGDCNDDTSNVCEWEPIDLEYEECAKWTPGSNCTYQTCSDGETVNEEEKECEQSVDDPTKVVSISKGEEYTRRPRDHLYCTCGNWAMSLCVENRPQNCEEKMCGKPVRDDSAITFGAWKDDSCQQHNCHSAMEANDFTCGEDENMIPRIPRGPQDFYVPSWGEEGWSKLSEENKGECCRERPECDKCDSCAQFMATKDTAEDCAKGCDTDDTEWRDLLSAFCPNSCKLANDNWCDEEKEGDNTFGWCDPGTDTNDCDKDGWSYTLVNSGPTICPYSIVLPLVMLAMSAYASNDRDWRS